MDITQAKLIFYVSDGRVLGCVRFYRLRFVVLLFCTEHVFEGYKVFSGCVACGLALISLG